MARWLVFLFFLVDFFGSNAQGIDVDFDKKRDFSVYRTFRLGEGEVITPKEKQQSSAKELQGWMKTAIQEKLRDKGLVESDSSADLIVTYLIGSKEEREDINLGVQLLGGGISSNSPSTDPGKSNKTWSRSYSLGKIIIDLADRSGTLVWRIKATTENAEADTKSVIDEVVRVGFKKFSTKPKKK